MNSYLVKDNMKTISDNSTLVNQVAFLLFLLALPITYLFAYYNLFGSFSSIEVILFNYLKLLITGFIIIYFISNSDNFKNKISLLFIFFYIYIFLYSILNYNYYEIISVKMNIKYFRYIYVVLIAYLTFFLIGFYNRDYRKYFKYILIFYVLLTVNAWINVDPQTLYISFKGVDKDLIGVYQKLGDIYAIIAIIFILLIKRNKYIQLSIIIISFITLFILMSRSSLYVYTITMLFYLVVIYRFKAVFYILFIVSIIMVFIVDSGTYYDIIMNSRLTSFMRSGEDGSWVARKQLAEVGINAIKNYWLIGDYGGDIIQFRETGNYIHSYLSILRQFGLIPFLIIFYWILLFSYRLFKWMLDNSKYSDYYNIFIILFLFNLIEISIARSFGSPYIFISIGMLASIYSNPALIYKKTEVQNRII